MSAANGSAIPGDASEITAKGKGKAVDPVPAQDMSMDEDDSSEEESANEEPHDEEEDEEEDDGMDEIDLGNIVAGRTRGKNINWAEADQKAKEAGDELDDEDDEDDEDFEDHEGADRGRDRDAMEE